MIYCAHTRKQRIEQAKLGRREAGSCSREELRGIGEAQAKIIFTGETVDMNMECVFCRIVRGELPSAKIYETEMSVAFLDINPISPGHTLVIPKTHVSSMIELDENTTADLFNAVRMVMRLLNEALHPDGFNIGINDGKEAGQEIMHLHVNVIPRFKGDGGKSIHAIVNNPPSESVEDIARKIVRRDQEA